MTGEQIRLTRIFHSPPLSQAALSQCLRRQGVTLDQGAISRIENRTRNVSDYELFALAKCLGVPVERLFVRK